MAGFLRVNKDLSRFALPERVFMFFARRLRGITLGVRTIVFDDAGRVLLVRHSYTPGWHFPGGGVEAGETAEEAAAREMEEESGVRPTGPLEFHGLHLYRKYGGRDHVVVYVCKAWERVRQPKIPNFEITGCDFFPLDALPPDISPATGRRLAELAGGPMSPDW